MSSVRISRALTYHWLRLQHGEEGKVGWIETKHEKGCLSSQIWHVLPDMIVDLGFVIEMRNRKSAFSDFLCCRKCAPNVMLQRRHFSRQPREHNTLTLLNLTSSDLTGTSKESFPPLGHCEDSLRTLFTCQVSTKQRTQAVSGLQQRPS